MDREPVDSAKDAKLAAMRGDENKALTAMADAIQGIAEYQRYVRSDLAAIKKALHIR